MTASGHTPGAADLGGAPLVTTARFLIALSAAAAITIALFFLMRALIWTEIPPPADVVEVPAFVIAEIPPEKTIDQDRFPELPEAVAPPPQIQPVPIDPSAGPGVSPSATPLPTVRVDPDIDSLRQVAIPPPPLEFRARPTYPPSELRRGVEGSCLVQYDILANGRTANARALACDSPGFARAALAAVAQWRHAAVTGAAQDSIVQRRVQTRLDFELEG